MAMEKNTKQNESVAPPKKRSFFKQCMDAVKGLSPPLPKASPPPQPLSEGWEELDEKEEWKGGFNGLPQSLFQEIGSHLDTKNLQALLFVNRRLHETFQGLPQAFEDLEKLGPNPHTLLALWQKAKRMHLDPNSMSEGEQDFYLRFAPLIQSLIDAENPNLTGSEAQAAYLFHLQVIPLIREEILAQLTLTVGLRHEALQALSPEERGDAEQEHIAALRETTLLVSTYIQRYSHYDTARIIAFDDLYHSFNAHLFLEQKQAHLHADDLMVINRVLEYVRKVDRSITHHNYNAERIIQAYSSRSHLHQALRQLPAIKHPVLMALSPSNCAYLLDIPGLLDFLKNTSPAFQAKFAADLSKISDAEFSDISDIHKICKLRRANGVSDTLKQALLDRAVATQNWDEMLGLFGCDHKVSPSVRYYVSEFMQVMPELRKEAKQLILRFRSDEDAGIAIQRVLMRTLPKRVSKLSDADLIKLFLAIDIKDKKIHRKEGPASPIQGLKVFMSEYSRRHPDKSISALATAVLARIEKLTLAGLDALRGEMTYGVLHEWIKHTRLRCLSRLSKRLWEEERKNHAAAAAGEEKQAENVEGENLAAATAVNHSSATSNGMRDSRLASSASAPAEALELSLDEDFGFELIDSNDIPNASSAESRVGFFHSKLGKPGGKGPQKSSNNDSCALQ